LAGFLNDNSGREDIKTVIERFKPADEEMEKAINLMKNRYAIYSDNDHLNPKEELERYADKFKANKIFIRGIGHMGRRAGVKQIPEIIEIIRNRKMHIKYTDNVGEKNNDVGVKENILKFVKENKNITIKELAVKLNTTTRTIERNLKTLKDTNILKRVGSDKTGHWELLKLDLKQIVESHKEELIENLKSLVAYESVLVESEGNTPYGEQNAQCLQKALELAESCGLQTNNLNNKCGYAQIGQGKEIVGVLAHLDVVPAGNNWDTNPYVATIKDGKIYGRGTSDDKGAIVSSMLALKIIKELDMPLTKRVRLIMGCKEETGSEDMEYYIEKEGHINVGFTPDGRFPVVHGEKGHIRAIFKSTNTSILNIQGGVIDNAVSDNCTITIKSNTCNKHILKNYFEENNIGYTITEKTNMDIIETMGVSAHASRPELGKNAISYLIVGLKEAGYEDEFVEFYYNTIGLRTNGESLGIACKDEYGELTCVNGKIYMENKQIVGTIDIRVPVTLESQDIVDKLLDNKNFGGTIEIISFSETTFFSLDSELVKVLMQVYQDTTGDLISKPITTGGGTYAKTMNNCIAFGCKFPNTENNIHNSNEYVDIDELLLQVEIYIRAIIKLIEL
jgi:succinyl-diaminopimelate desuccinylase